MVFIQHDGRNFSAAISNLTDDDVLYIRQKKIAAQKAAFELSLQEANFHEKAVNLEKLGEEEFVGIEMRSTNRPITIIAVLDYSNHGIPLCNAVQADQGDSVTNLRGILVRKLPDSVVDFVNRANYLADVIEQDERAAARADAVAPHSDATVTKTDAAEHSVATRIGKGEWIQNGYAASTTKTTPQLTPERAQANQMMVEVNDEKKELEKMKASYYRNATIIAFPSNELYGDHQVWYCERLQN
jgi:hypothetical protein